MKNEDLIRNILQAEIPKHKQRISTIRQLLEYRAKLHDSKTNNRLLHQLILKYSDLEKKQKALNRELTVKQNLIEKDLVAAGKIQRSLLPNESSSPGGLVIAWKFKPCQKVGGDIFNLFQLDDEHCVIYMVDVAGHGVPAAMVAVSVFQYLQPNCGNLMMTDNENVDTREIQQPGQVLTSLDQEFTFERFNTFITMTYVIINSKTGELISSRAGHPPPIILRKDGMLQLLKKGGPALGTLDLRSVADGSIEFKEEHSKIYPGDKLILYTDGVNEYQNAKGELYGNDRFFNHLKQLRDQTIETLLEGVFNSLIVFGNNSEPKDDVSLLGLELSMAE